MNDKEFERVNRSDKSPSALQAVLEALEDFVAADSWADARRIVEIHRDKLLSDMVDDVLTTLMARYEDAEVVQLLSRYRQVLIRCRSEGIDAVFSELTSEERDGCPAGVDPRLWQRVLEADSYASLMFLITEHPDLAPYLHRYLARTMSQEQRALWNALDIFLAADSWTKLRHIIESYPILLDLEADIWLGQYTQSLAGRDDVESAATVMARRWLLAWCRQMGIGATFLKLTSESINIKISVDRRDPLAYLFLTDLAQVA